MHLYTPTFLQITVKYHLDQHALLNTAYTRGFCGKILAFPRVRFLSLTLSITSIAHPNVLHLIIFFWLQNLKDLILTKIFFKFWILDKKWIFYVILVFYTIQIILRLKPWLYLQIFSTFSTVLVWSQLVTVFACIQHAAKSYSSLKKRRQDLSKY